MSVEKLHQDLNDIEDLLQHADDPGMSPASRPEIASLMNIIDEAMKLEGSDAEGAVDVLSHALRITTEDTAAATILNNLGCVEKRRGNLKLAVYYFDRAADKECGLASASPSTLLNLSATYSALKMYAEAAATANHAVLRCNEGYHPVRPIVHAAAYHNLATALEGSGELFAASEAFSMALKLIADIKGTPTYRTIERASEQLELKLRNLKAQKQQDEWQREVVPSIIRRTAKVLRKHGRLPPLKEATHPVVIRDTENLYTQSLRKFHAVRSLRGSPALIKSGSSMEVSTFVRQPLPPWNADPLPWRPTAASPGKQAPPPADIEQRVEEHFLPRVLCSLVESLRYKESMHRLAIRGEWKRQRKMLKLKMQLHFVCALEDEARAAIEIEEARVWRVVVQWATGKLLFVEGSLEVEQEETAAREAIVQEMYSGAKEMSPTAKRLQFAADEESNRCNTCREEGEARHDIDLQNETDIATVLAADAARTPDRGLAYALALWSVESSLGHEATEKLIREEMKSSLHVLERYATFGIPPELSRKDSTTKRE